LPVGSFYEIERQVYSGSASGGSLLESIYTCYEINPSTCSSTSGDSGTAVAALTNIQGATLWPSGTSPSAGYVNTYDSFGNILTHAVHDYGASGVSGALLQTTTTTYTTSYGGDLPTEVKVTDGGGSTVSDTKYTYTGAVTSTTSTPNHVSSPVRGNIYSVQQMINSGSYLMTYYSYYDTGNVYTTTDPNGGVTTYSYGSSSCGNSFPTSVSSPTIGSITLATSATWNCVGGVQVTSQDVNGNTTTYGYGSDPYWRPVAVTNNATTAVTNYSYPTSSSNSSTVSMNFNGSTSTSTSVTTYDALGRTIVQQTQKGQGLSSYDTVATAYDALGRVAKTTLPYQSSMIGQDVPSNPGTATTYEPLGRTWTVTDGGGGTKTYTYAQNNLLVAVGPAPGSENVKKRNLQYNGAGWLTSVCEVVTSTSPAGGACGHSTSYTGYLTNYSYDGAGRLTQVQQNAQSSPMQTRMVNYDWLGRKKSESIPEWSSGSGSPGTTTYTYDSASGCSGSSPGDLIETVDNMGNSTCFTYDKLHRPTSSYVLPSSPYYSVTPITHAVYDAASLPSSAGGAAMTNAMGQVAEAYTCSTSACTTKLTDAFFSASPVTGGPTAGGVQSQMWESTPHSGGYFLTQETFYPNGAVGSLSGSLVGNTAGSTTNMITDSSQFGGSGWTEYCAGSSNGMVLDTPSVTAPDGSNTATQFTMPSSFSCGTSNPWGAFTSVQAGLITGGTYTVSAWLKGAVGGEGVSFGLNDCAGTQFALTTSWQRYTWTATSIPLSVVNCSGGARGFEIDGYTANSTFYVWGPQTEQSASVTPYVATTYSPGTYIGIPEVTYSLDGEGRPATAADGTDGLNLVTGVTYNNASLPAQITYGNAGTGSGSDVDNFTYDPYTFRPTNLTYNIKPTSGAYAVTTALTWNANSSLQQMVYTDGSPSPLSQTCNYTADDLSRIASSSCVNNDVPQWGQTFSYDPFGNITKAGSNGGTSYSAIYNTSTNQVSSGITPAPTYDANGNQKTATPATLTWNALNQPITVNSTTATYDALGRMVEKGLGSTYTQFVYNPDGTNLAVYSGGLTKGTISLPGGSTAVYNASGLNFIRHKDWLGSSRLATTWAHAVYAKEAYAPFGETYNEAGTADRSFTGQDQNVVTNSGGTGVYDYLFRKYDPSAGRWLSPDPYGWGAVSLHRPQSLNRYAYVQNGPLTLIDPDGTSIGCDDEDGCDSGDGDLGEGDIPGFSPAPPDPGPTPPWDTPALDPDPGAFFDGGAGLSYDNGYRGDDDPSICDLASGCFEYYLQTQMWPASSATVEVASAPNNAQSYSYFKQWLKDVKSCFVDTGLGTIANQMDPFSPSASNAVQGAVDSASQAALAGAAVHSVERGLTVPLRSSIVRAGAGASEALGEASGWITIANLYYGIGKAYVAEWKQCGW